MPDPLPLSALLIGSVAFELIDGAFHWPGDEAQKVFREDHRLRQLMDAKAWTRTPAPMAWVGDPVAIKDPTGVTFRRHWLPTALQSEFLSLLRKHSAELI